MADSSESQILEPSLTGLIAQIVDDDPTIEQALGRIVELANHIIQGADGASLTLYRPDVTPFTQVASHEWVRAVDRVQYETKQGPCIEVATSSAPASGSAELADSESWPVFGPAAAQLGVRAVLAVGLVPRPDPSDHAQGPLGALNLYARRPYAFGTADRDEALLLAAIAGQSLQLVEARADIKRLREALSSRDVIGQAKGILMERHGIREAEAFAILRRASNDVNVKLRDIAARVAEANAAADVDR